MALSAPQLRTIAQARRSAVRDCFDRLSRHWRSRRWLSRGNRYRENCVSQIRSEYDAAETLRQSNNAPRADLNQFWQPSHRQLCDYVAASTLTHCADGWTYLGQAVSAELAGACNVARHLGYYAELRAAMSILAGEGIGIFDSHHVAVVSRGKCALIPMGGGGINKTHQFTWEVLRQWASGSAGPDLLGRVIVPGRVPLSDWMNQYALSGTSLATSWLTQWGLDLSRIAHDREARNLASYRPTAFTSPGPSTVHDTLQAICAMWSICRPGVFGGFPELDRHLLRRALERTFSDAFGKREPRNHHTYAAKIDRMLNSISLLEGSSQQWKKFLEFDDDPEVPQLLRDAASIAGPEDPRHSQHVMARAVLMLRLATGSVADLLRDVTSPGIPELGFWWLHDVASARLWSKESPPHPFPDLWTEIEDATSSVTSWLSESEQPCRYRLRRERGEAITALSTTERVALWGLGL